MDDIRNSSYFGGGSGDADVVNYFASWDKKNRVSPSLQAVRDDIFAFEEEQKRKKREAEQQKLEQERQKQDQKRNKPSGGFWDFLNAIGGEGGVADKTMGDLSRGLAGGVAAIPGKLSQAGSFVTDSIGNEKSAINQALQFVPGAGNTIRLMNQVKRETEKATGKPFEPLKPVSDELDKFSRASDEWINKNTKLGRDSAKNKVMYDIGNGIESLAESIGITLASGGSTIPGTLYTGLTQAGNIYGEMKRSGMDQTKAQNYSSMAGVVEGALEKAGLDEFFAPGKTLLRRVLAQAISEGVQEGSQTLGENAVRKISGLNPDIGLGDNVLYSAALGAGIGGGAGFALSTQQKNAIVSAAKEEGLTPEQTGKVLLLAEGTGQRLLELQSPQQNTLLPAQEQGSLLGAGTAIPGTVAQGQTPGGGTVVVPNSPGYDATVKRITEIDQKLASFKQGGDTKLSTNTMAKLQQERSQLVATLPDPNQLVQVSEPKISPVQKLDKNLQPIQETSQDVTPNTPSYEKSPRLRRDVTPIEYDNSQLAPEKVKEATTIANDYAGQLSDMQKQTGGVQIIGNTRQSSNPDWYQKFYKENKRIPTKANIVDIAHERLLSGEAFDEMPPESIQRYQELYQEHADLKPTPSDEIEQLFSRNTSLKTVMVDKETGMTFLNKHWVKRFDQNLKLVEKNGSGFAGTFGIDPSDRSKTLITLVKHAEGRLDMVAAMHELGHGIRALAMTDRQRAEGDKLIGERFKNDDLAKKMTPAYTYYESSDSQKTAIREGLTRLSALYKDVSPPVNDIPSKSLQTLYFMYEKASPGVRETIETTGGKELTQLLRESKRQITTGDFSSSIAEELFVQAGAEYHAGKYQKGIRGTFVKLRIWFDNLINSLKKSMGLEYDKLKEMWANVYSNRMGVQTQGNKYTQSDKAFLREDGKPTELMVTHNLSADNLMNALRIGGIPQASLAISNPKKFGMDGYGEITLVGNNALVDPKAKGTKTYASDVYSPRQPRSQYLADDASIAKIKERLAPAMDKLGEKYVNISPSDSVVDGLESSPAAIATFLSEKGFKPNYGENISESRSNFREQMYEYKLYDDFATWTRDLAKSSGAPSKIFGGWTNSGNKRLLDDTVDNALKVMRQEARQGGDTTPGLGNIRARITPQFKSIQDIINAKDKLTSTEKMDAVKQTLEAKIYGIQEKLDKYAANRDSNRFTEYDRQMDAIGDYMKGDAQWFESKFPDAPASIKQELDKFRTELQNAPTEYFESVSDRAVQINEFEKALVPENVSPEIVDALKQQGLDVVTYKEGERQQKLQELAQADNQDTAPKKDPLEALKAEARKYKSADEFVKAQGEPLYHGTKTGTSFDSFDTNKMQRGNRGKNVYLSESPVAAKYFGGLVDGSEFNNGSVLNFYKRPGTKILKVESIPSTPSAAENVIAKAKADGYDGISFPESLLSTVEGVDIRGAFRNGKPANTTIIFSPENVMSSKQLTDIYNQATKGSLPDNQDTAPKKDPLEALKAEARKYKSAEEFVNSKANAYHGSDNIFDEMQVGRPTKRRLMFGEYDTTSEGMFFAPDEKIAREFGENVGKYYVDVKKPLVFSDRANDSFFNEFDKSIENVKGIDIKPGESGFSEWMYLDGELGKRFKKFAKSKGFDGAKIDEVSEFTGDDFATTVAFENNQVKSTKQLTDLYNQATKGSLPDNQVKASISSDEQTALDKLNEKIKSGRELQPTRRQKAKQALSEAEIQFVDKYAPLADLSKAYKDITGQELEAEADPYVAARLYAGVTGKINQKLDELKSTIKSAPDFQALEQAGVLRRILTDRSGIENPISQEDAQAAQDELKAKLGEEKWQQTQQAVDKVIAFHDDLLKVLRDNGIISAESYDGIKENNENYFTKFDVVDYLVENSDKIRPGVSFNVAKQDVIKRQKGTDKAILSPIESTIRQTAKIMSLVERNQVGQKLAALADVEGMQEVIRELESGETVPSDMEKVSTFENGVKVDYVVPKTVGEAFKRLNKHQADLMTRVMRRQASWLRTGATSANLGFALIANPIRDVQSLAFNSRNMSLVSLPYYWISGMKSAILQDESYREFVEGGGSQSGQFSIEDVPQDVKSLKQSTASKIGHTITNPKELFGLLPTINAVGNKFELAPRLAEFKAARKKGKTVLSAAFDARNVTVDFSKSGEAGQILNQWVPFLNARGQGTLNVVKSFQKHPVRSSFVAASIVILPAILSYLHNRKEYPEEYEKIPGYIKDNYFIVIYGKGTDADGNLTQVVKIPKGEVGKIIGNPIEKYMDSLYTKQPVSYAGLALDFSSNLSPVDFSNGGKFAPGRALGGVMPPGVKAIVEGLTNYSFYKDEPLVQGKLADMPAKDQYYESTSELSKWIGARTGVSPIAIDNGIRDVTGGFLNQFSQKGLQKGTVGRIMGAPGNEQENKFYDNYNRLQKERNAASDKVNKAIGAGNTAEARSVADQHNAQVDSAFKNFNFDSAPDLQDKAAGLKINLTDKSIKQRQNNIDKKTESNTKDDTLRSGSTSSVTKRSTGRKARAKKLKFAKVRAPRARKTKLTFSKPRKIKV